MTAVIPGSVNADLGAVATCVAGYGAVAVELVGGRVTAREQGCCGNRNFSQIRVAHMSDPAVAHSAMER